MQLQSAPDELFQDYMICFVVSVILALLAPVIVPRLFFFKRFQDSPNMKLIVKGYRILFIFTAGAMLAFAMAHRN